MDSFLYPEVPRVNVLRSLSCSPIDPSKNSPSNCHFVFQSSLEFPDLGTQISGIVQLDLLSPLRKTPPLQRSMLSSSEALIQISQYGYRSALPIPSWLYRVASKVTAHEDCDLLNMVRYLSGCFGAFPPDTALHASTGKSRIHEACSLLWAKCF